MCHFKHSFFHNCRSDEKLELQWTLEGHQLGVVSVDISHNGAIAASSSLDAHIRLWDLETGKQIKSLDAGPGEFRHLLFQVQFKIIPIHLCSICDPLLRGSSVILKDDNHFRL